MHTFNLNILCIQVNSIANRIEFHHNYDKLQQQKHMWLVRVIENLQPKRQWNFPEQNHTDKLSTNKINNYREKIGMRAQNINSDTYESIELAKSVGNSRFMHLNIVHLGKWSNSGRVLVRIVEIQNTHTHSRCLTIERQRRRWRKTLTERPICELRDINDDIRMRGEIPLKRR